MVTLNLIEEFLSTKKIAIAGVSRNPKKFGYLVFKSLTEKGYDVCPINPNTNKIDSVNCYPSIESIPDGYDRLLVLSPENTTNEVISSAQTKNIKYLWFQQEKTPIEKVKEAEEKGMKVIYKKCIFMFTEPVSGGHKFHRSIVKLFGAYPKKITETI